MYEAASLSRPLEAGLALLLSLLRPLHGGLVQRAVLRRSGRAALADLMAVPRSSHLFVGFERPHLAATDRLHTHRLYRSAAVGLDGRSSLELGLVAEHGLSLAFAVGLVRRRARFRRVCCLDQTQHKIL